MGVEIWGTTKRYLRFRSVQIGLTGCLSVPLAFSFWDSPFLPESKFGGTLERVQSVEIKNFDRADNISPLCGCIADLSQESWSGISFARKSIEAKFIHENDDRFAIVASAPFPGPISPNSSINISAFITYKGNYNKDRLPQRWIDINHLRMVLSDPVQISSDDDSEIASFLPAPFSNTKLKFDTENDDISIISERISGNLQIENYDYYYDFPAIDVKSDLVQIKPKNGFEDIILASEAGKNQDLKNLDFDPKNVESITLRVPYSARLSFLSVQTSNDEIAQITNEIPALPSGGSIILASPGRIEISATGTLENSAYEDAARQYDGEKIVSASGAASSGYQIMTYRVPLMPPKTGFQIYGEIKGLLLKGAVGGLTIGSKDFPLSGPSELEFSDVKPLIREGEYQSSPVIFDREKSTLMFNAKSRISVNGEQVAASIITLGWLFAFLTPVFAAIVGAFRAVDWFKQNKEPEPGSRRQKQRSRRSGT